jgi:peptide/nickel transport system ATP-binding protein
MYCGKVIEEAPVKELFANPLHPYTVGLLNSKPSINKDAEVLYSIPGQVPNPIGLNDDCHFCPRCNKATKQCRENQPHLININEDHKVACWLYEEVK